MVLAPHDHLHFKQKSTSGAGQLLLASRLGGVLPGLARIRPVIVAVRKTSGAVTEPRHPLSAGRPAWAGYPFRAVAAD
jgi:hypothetical protein